MNWFKEMISHGVYTMKIGGDTSDGSLGGTGGVSLQE